MENRKIIKDIICQVLAKIKSKELIYLVLNEFIPSYEPINLDYVGKPEDENYEFKSEDELISFYTTISNVSRTFYWRKENNNPDRIMIGANILSDDQIVFSLTFDGDIEKENNYLNRLKKLLNSNVGVVSYINPVEYKNGRDFMERYSNLK